MTPSEINLEMKMQRTMAKGIEMTTTANGMNTRSIPIASLFM